jgi:hypothetical protein
MKVLQSNLISTVTEMIGEGVPIPLTSIDMHKPAFFPHTSRGERFDALAARSIALIPRKTTHHEKGGGFRCEVSADSAVTGPQVAPSGMPRSPCFCALQCRPTTNLFNIHWKTLNSLLIELSGSYERTLQLQMFASEDLCLEVLS